MPKLSEIVKFLKDQGRHKSARLIQKEFGGEDKTTKRVATFVKTHKALVGHGQNVEDLTSNNRVVEQVKNAIEASDALYADYEHVAKSKNMFMKMFIRAVVEQMRAKGQKPRWSDYSRDWVIDKAEEYFVDIEVDDDSERTNEFYSTYLMHMIVMSEGTLDASSFSISKGTVAWNHVVKSRKLADRLNAPYFAFIEAQIEELKDIGFTPGPKQMCTDKARERWRQWYNKTVKTAAGMSESYVFKMKKRMFKQKYKEITGGR